MKKILAVFLCIALLFSLAACSNSSDDDGSSYDDGDTYQEQDSSESDSSVQVYQNEDELTVVVQGSEVEEFFETAQDNETTVFTVQFNTSDDEFLGSLSYIIYDNNVSASYYSPDTQTSVEVEFNSNNEKIMFITSEFSLDNIAKMILTADDQQSDSPYYFETIDMNQIEVTQGEYVSNGADAEDIYGILGVYAGYSYELDAYTFFEISTDEFGYILNYNDCTYTLTQPSFADAGEGMAYLVGGEEDSSSYIKLMVQYDELNVSLYEYNDEDLMYTNDYVSCYDSNIFEAASLQYYYYDENNEQVFDSVKFETNNNFFKVVINDRYETDWLELAFENYSMYGRIYLSNVAITDTQDDSVNLLLDLNVITDEFYNALSYTIMLGDVVGQYYVDKNFLIADLDVANEMYETTKDNLIGYYVNSNGSIDFEITENEMYLLITYIEQFYDMTLLTEFNMDMLIASVDSYSTMVITQNGECTYAISMMPYITGVDDVISYTITLYEFEYTDGVAIYEEIFSDVFTMQ